MIGVVERAAGEDPERDAACDRVGDLGGVARGDVEAAAGDRGQRGREHRQRLDVHVESRAGKQAQFAREERCEERFRRSGPEPNRARLRAHDGRHPERQRGPECRECAAARYLGANHITCEEGDDA
jgi:hypothetical protein